MKPLKSFALAIAAGAAACSDPASPGEFPTRSITVNLCAALAPGAWLAYQNQGGAWTQLSPNGSGQITFDATEKVSIASAYTIFTLSFTQILNTTATELEGTTGVDCEGDFGDKTLSGTVAGLGTEEFARISAAGSIDGAYQVSPGWVLEELPTHALDIVATRYPSFSAQPANRVLVRRGVTENNGAIPVLDFGGSESAPLESAIATFTGIPANGSLTMISAVRTANATGAQLGDMSLGPLAETSQDVAYVSLPASLRIASDLHMISASGSNATVNNSIVHYYKVPSAKTLAFGPVLNSPTTTNTTTTGLVLPRVQLTSQAEYPSALVMEFGETAGQNTRYTGVFTTAGFLGGTPATWDVTVPDMTAAGYNAAWGISTTNYNWSVTAYGTTGDSWPLGTAPVEGMTVKSSTRGKIDVLERRLPRRAWFR